MKMAICSVLLFTLTVVEATAGANELTYTDLVERLYDMKFLATPPDPGEKSGEISLGTLELQPGKHILRATLTGANDQSKNAVGVGRHLFGLDYLRLEPR